MVVLRATPQRRPGRAKVELTSDARVLVGIRCPAAYECMRKTGHFQASPRSADRSTRQAAPPQLTITNTIEDFRRLTGILPKLSLPVRAGFEAPGNYHRALMHHLGDSGFDLKLVSSIALARTREALHYSWDKNDPKDGKSSYTCCGSGPLRSSTI